MSVGVAVLILLAILSVVAIIVIVIWKGVPDTTDNKNTDNKNTDNKESYTYVVILNKLIVIEKQESASNPIHQYGVHFGIKYTLRVYDTFMDKYDEVIVTEDTYRKAEVNKGFTLDLKQFSHYERIDEKKLEQIKGWYPTYSSI